MPMPMPMPIFASRRATLAGTMQSDDIDTDGSAGTLLQHDVLAPSESRSRAEAFRTTMVRRRSVRHFSCEPVDLTAVRSCIAAAATAPSGANKQPWTFVLVTSATVKRKIRLAAEEEERAFYEHRAPASWLADLQPLGTDWRKPFLEEAPALIAVFAQRFGPANGEKHYYVAESVGITVGFLIAALHHAGFATLTHTPSPMAFLSEVLGRPASERAFVLLPVGLPAPNCRVPAITRKPISDVLVEISDS